MMRPLLALLLFLGGFFCGLAAMDSARDQEFAQWVGAGVFQVGGVAYHIEGVAK